MKARCADPVLVPPAAQDDEELQWRLWGLDRKALSDCGAMNDAKATTIEALEGQAAR
ncbi:MAG TPA: hypothetical protein VE079_16040 [Ensifer sp.]|nr:hypothetical protein [Ensifer sp.]